MLPGAEEVLALLELRDQVASGRFDVVVVDCAPTAETLRLLALPEALSWYVDRVLPGQRRMVKALRPVLTRAAGVPMPRDHVFDALERLHADLIDVHGLSPAPTRRRDSCSPPSGWCWQRPAGRSRRSRCTATRLTAWWPTGSSPPVPTRGPARRPRRVRPGLARGVGARAGRGARRGGRVVRPAAGVAGGDGATEPIGSDALAAVAAELYAGTDPLARHPGPDAVPGPARRRRAAALPRRSPRGTTSTWLGTVTTWW